MKKKHPLVDAKAYGLAATFLLSEEKFDHAATNDEIMALAVAIQTACEDAYRELEARQPKKVRG
jgi:hypothetical protein